VFNFLFCSVLFCSVLRLPTRVPTVYKISGRTEKVIPPTKVPLATLLEIIAPDAA